MSGQGFSGERFSGQGFSGERLRIDLWLWRARFLKSRALAQAAVTEGRVRLRRGGTGDAVRLSKPSTEIAPGDEIAVAVHGRVRAVRVLALAERRGPAAEAQALWEDVTG